MADLAVGSVIDRYRIDAELGRGGMGVVYRATHLALDAPRALKVVSARLAAEPGFRARFEREARTASRLRHPHVARVYDFGEHDGMPFLVMELLEGEDLAGLVDREGPFSDERAVALLEGIASALDVAHADGLVHRDVKPHNILVTRTPHGEHPYLTDFGLSKHLTDTGLTQPDQALGTPGYMAPEQLAGGPIDRRVDVYALGRVLGFMVHGRPTRLRDVVDQAVAYRPEDRFPTAGAVAAAAREALSRPAPAEPPPSVRPPPARDATETATTTARLRVPKRVPREAVAGVLAGLAVVAVVVLIAGRDSGDGGGGGGDGGRDPGPERALRAKVPEAVEASCRTDPAPPPGARAALACATADADEVRYFDFAGAQAAGAYHAERMADAGVVTDQGDCVGDLPAEEGFDGDDGRRVCADALDGGRIDWVLTDDGLAGVVRADRPFDPLLLDAWDRVVPR